MVFSKGPQIKLFEIWLFGHFLWESIGPVFIRRIAEDRGDWFAFLSQFYVAYIVFVSSTVLFWHSLWNISNHDPI